MPVHPIHFLVVERQSSGWVFKVGNIFYNPSSVVLGSSPSDFLTKLLDRHNLSQSQVITELFKINAGRFGFYIADLRSREFYYCGLSWDDVNHQFKLLGIGRDDPMNTMP